MSEASRQPQESVDKLTLADLLKPMQFKALLLAAGGLQNSEIGEFLGTTEGVIKNVLADVYHCTGCSNSGEVLRRYFREVSSGLLEVGRLRRELAELEDRIGQDIYARLGDFHQYLN